MKIAEWLKLATAKLTGVGIGTARLDCLVLLEDCLGRDRAWILANQEAKLSQTQQKTLNKQIDRRSGFEPLSYIRGFSEFYGRRFRVSRRVLEPRPESEAIIEQLKNLKLTKPAIADIGTGSGCLGLTAALEIDGAKVDLYDIDSNALAIAKHNAHMHEIEVQAYKRNLLNRPKQRYDVILANLPYIPDNWNLDRSIQSEPRIALKGGLDGLRLYDRLFEQLHKLTWTPVYVITECMPPQHTKLLKIALTHGFEQIAEEDFVQVFTNQAKLQELR
jgi:release factor glutamine methyltransferase